MILRCPCRGVFAAALLSLFPVSVRAQAVQTGFIALPDDQVWEWLMILDGGGVQQDPSHNFPAFLSTWTTPAYNGPAFRSSAAPLSYGGIAFFMSGSVPPGSPLDYPAAGSRLTVYFRTTINLPDELLRPVLDFVVDDGLILYVDGVRWVTQNMLSANPTSAFNELAATAAPEDVMTTISTGADGITALPSLAAGPHLICASVHNQAVTSSDLGFMLRITGDLRLPPSLTAIPATPSTDGSPRVLLSAANLDQTVTYIVQSSTDLTNWGLVTTFPATQDRTQFTLDIPATAGKKYFRLAKQ